MQENGSVDRSTKAQISQCWTQESAQSLHVAKRGPTRELNNVIDYDTDTTTSVSREEATQQLLCPITV